MKKDIFISHASEDKKAIVEPLVKTLEANNISCWYDANEIGWGDSITSKINQGLANSKYGLVVLSEVFINKGWTIAELNNLLNMEISNGEKKVLPLLVGDEETILSKLPLLRDKKYIVWEDNPHHIVSQLSKVLKREIVPQHIEDNFSIPMPKRKITQLDKDKFSKRIYQGIVKYFEDGLAQLENHDASIETDMTKVNELKFVAKIYIDGEVKSQCKIVLGGMFGSNGISYSSNGYDIHDDNSCNDWLFLEEDEDGLYMKGSNLNMFRNQDKKIRNEREAGEYFWTSFIAPIER